MAAKNRRSRRAALEATGEKARRQSGELEGDVLAVLWSAGSPMTAARVLEQVSDDLAYSTVVTILTRLQAKGVLQRQKVGRSFEYSPVADEPGLTAWQMHGLLDAEADRETVLTRFVTDLSPEDEELLRSLLAGAQDPSPRRAEDGR